ncbi:hypothetical protein INR49_022331 [Caranx melampygus]|nr:hypothetical protein INR49_022331 [Caranx melampygus]
MDFSNFFLSKGISHLPAQPSNHSPILRGLGTVRLDGEGLYRDLEGRLSSIRVEGKHWSISGINLQIHEQTRKHLGKLQREGKRYGTYASNNKDGDVKEDMMPQETPPLELQVEEARQEEA